MARGTAPSVTGGAARKALRHARLMLGRPLPPSGGELLAGLRATTELALRLTTPARGLVALDGSAAGAALERFFPGEAANVVERAERVLAGRLEVFGHSLNVRSPGGATDWQRDFLNGGSFSAFAPAEMLPRVPRMRQHKLDMVSVPLADVALRDCDAVVIATDHSTVDYARVVAGAPLVIDTRNACRYVTVGREKILKS